MIHKVNYTNYVGLNKEIPSITMDVTIAKREARRRRILENSERRLQKITGASTEYTSSNVVSSNLEKNGLYVNTKIFEDKHDTSHYRGDNTVTNKEKEKEKEKENTESHSSLSDVSNNCNNKCNDTAKDKFDYTNNKSNLNHLDYYNENLEYIQEKSSSSNYQMQNNVCNKSILSYNLLSNHISYIVLAAIVNILLLFQMDHLFGKYIIIPCIIMMIGRLYTHTKIQEPQHGSPLIATLILCNIKPVLTYRISRALSIFTLIISDLALYIFSFAMINYGIIHYLQDFNISIASII